MSERIDSEKTEAILFDFGIASSPLARQPKEQLESMTFFNEPAMHTFGALPYASERSNFINHLPEELAYFGYDQTPIGDNRDLTRTAEAALLFEMKAGYPLSQLAEAVLAHYPDLEKEGKVVSIFGLSGSGKSLALEAIRERYGDEAVVMDSDTARYNLLAKIVSDAEQTNGKTPEEIKASKVIHNRITGSFYTLLNYVTAELKKRGYLVVRAATAPYEAADIGLYIEHPDGIDPVSLMNVPEEQVKAAATELYRRTSERVSGSDNYDWDKPKLITKFEDMRDVTVQVPQAIHERFIYNVAEKLDTGPYRTVRNHKMESAVNAKAAILEQLSNFIKWKSDLSQDEERFEKNLNLGIESGNASQLFPEALPIVMVRIYPENEKCSQVA